MTGVAPHAARWPQPASMRRRCLIGGLLLGAGVRAQAPKPPLVGVLVSTGLTPLDDLRRGLSKLGYVEGQSVRYAFRSADGNPRDLPGLARHLASLDVEVLFCAGPAAVDAAVHASSRVKIVALDLETDPVRSGLVRSAAHPRTNVTGVFLDQPALTARWIDLLHQAAPAARRLSLFWEASTGPWQLAAAKNAASAMGFEIDTIVVRNERDFERALVDGLDTRPETMLLLSSPLVRARSAQLAEFTRKHHLPALSAFSEFARAGGLMSYGPDVPDFYGRAAVFVDKILKGARAGDLALDMPQDFSLVLNRGTAATLGLSLPPSLLSASRELIG
jgi:putative ABC transport system substrate-binding protein